VKLIQQREKSDCAICTIAMAIGRSYDEVMAAATSDTKWPAYKPDVGTRAEYAVLEALGLKQMEDFRVLHRGPLAPEYFLHFSWGRRSILAVPSLNIEDSFHSVYWSGTALFDPCGLKTYSDWKQLRPDEIILFAETGAHPK
jgi:hypothetical protein